MHRVWRVTLKVNYVNITNMKNSNPLLHLSITRYKSDNRDFLLPFIYFTKEHSIAPSDWQTMLSIEYIDPTPELQTQEIKAHRILETTIVNSIL